MQGEHGVKSTDYGVRPTAAGPPRLPEQPIDRSFLGPADSHQHLRDQSIDHSESESYDLSALQRSDSHTPLQDQQGYSHGGYLPSGASAPYVQQPRPAATTPPVHPAQRVHYPPSPQFPHRVQADSGYTTVPLNDEQQHLHSPQPHYGNPTTAGRGSPSPNPSGGNTPRQGHKKWSFLPSAASSTANLDATEKGAGGEGSQSLRGKRPRAARGGSWDLLGERAEWEDYKPQQASVENLRFAEGDAGTNKLSRLYYWALNRGIVVRWALYIIPILGLLWIPGILGLTATPDAKVWDVKLLWWSIWLSVLWGGFWASTALFMIVPGFWRNTVGAIIPSAKQYTDVIRNLGRYAKLMTWTVAMWISFTPLIINHFTGDQSSNSRSDLGTFVNILFGIFLCTIVLCIEKLVIQMIAFQFHRDSYEDRLREQKFNVKCLTTLYINSHDIPGRSDTLSDKDSGKTRGSQTPRVAIRKALRGLKEVAQTTTTALGNVASEMAGQSVLQTNSPANKVTAALTSANKSKALARRLYYSFRQPGVDHLDISDIARFFPDLDTAEAAFNIFDKDMNGDATRDEIEGAVMIMHRERLSLEASMRDLDGAVRRLDDIFMVIVLAIVILILAAMVTTKLTTLVTSAGTFILGLSWLIGSTMQEILLACIFLFVKHPMDVGDRCEIDGISYTVAKMQLLSTSFKRTDGKYVWIGNNILATKVIENVRRSGPTSESFTFEVAFDTSFEALQTLRAKMLAFCKANSRDFLPVFDVVVDDIPGQSKMVLKADIKYKSNWQQGALKVQRRNKWICALKLMLAELKIWGPAGAGNPTPDPAEPTKYTLVPYEEIVAAERQAAQPTSESPPPTFASATAGAGLLDHREVVNDSSADIWNEQEELATNAPSRAATPGPSGMASAVSTPGITAGQVRQRVAGSNTRDEAVDYVSAPVNRR